MEFYDSSNNNDGYTYTCDLCTVIPWLTYVAPDGNGSAPTWNEAFNVAATITSANVGEVWVITRTYKKALVDAATSPADSFSDTITIRVFGAANYCPEETRFVEDAYLAYYGNTKILKRDQPTWTLTLENGVDISPDPNTLIHANNCGTTADVSIIPAAGISVSPATVALSG
jgi:hypothetical protein